ncbi:exodeoxyribonuclease III [Roseibacillus ishigakijimensis]|uniref:Exodeoxyribonuclease III n=1 Tax=Roseibacillus ishigakijimensis TaxID=454146 RepID=A0A934RP11_9BACT|nr:exodeoxyribonuclease III [Roseibacillus ishigakijimensis]MBK1834338.1 exodeoxyribonuclease III [Roseibacillus ishigakijimensis]
MKLISWNVNGIRAALKKGLADFVAAEQPDIFCLQETKARAEQVDLPLEFTGYQAHWNSAEKAGYSGVAVFSKKEPLSIRHGMDIAEHDSEGRVITAEYPDFYLVTVYTPNSQNELRRLPYRQRWDADFLAFCQELETRKPVIFCGDLNVAHTEIDLARPKANRLSAGFSDEERAGFDAMMAAGFVDTFRAAHPGVEGAYTWWSYRGGARSRNVGWRLDYFNVSRELAAQAKDPVIYHQVLGSDHCPVGMTLA